MDVKGYFREVEQIASSMPISPIDEMVKLLGERSVGQRLFIIGLGGSAANASHACNDFVKLCGMDAYCLSDNIAELTARANDEGWNNIYSGWLKSRNAGNMDALFVLSVGGGTPKISTPLVSAIHYAKQLHMPVMGIVGKQDGYLQEHGFPVVVIPQVNGSRITPHAEEFQSVILHCLVTALQVRKTVW